MRRPSLLLAGLLIFLALAACSTPAPGETPSAPVEARKNTPAAPAVDTPTPPISENTPGGLTLATPTPVDPASASPTPMIYHVSEIPDASGYAWQPVASGLRQPVFLTGAGDASGRLFVVLQSGRIQVVNAGQVLEEPFLDISDRTSRSRAGQNYGERGLLGLAFHPRYSENGYFYVNYTDVDGHSVIARFQVSADNPNQADPASEQRLLFVEQPYPNHNGGMLAFGPDGYLYIGLGDGGSAGDPENRAQSPDTLLGKILRLDVDGGEPYAIPNANPYAAAGGRPEIWAIGLRNPWRFSFDRLTGDLYIGDVGQNQWEEVNFVAWPAPEGEALNFGWKYLEGSHAFEGETSLELQAPVAEYSHSLGCSVSGGVVYRGTNLPEWQGVYLYGDYCSGRVWGLLRTPEGGWLQAMLFEGEMSISSISLDDAGEVYLLDYRNDVIYRLERK